MEVPIITASSPDCVMSNMVHHLLLIVNEGRDGQWLGTCPQASPILPEIFFLTGAKKIVLSFISDCKNL